jgi:hypothetical protein
LIEEGQVDSSWESVVQFTTRFQKGSFLTSDAYGPTGTTFCKHEFSAIKSVNFTSTSIIASVLVLMQRGHTNSPLSSAFVRMDALSESPLVANLSWAIFIALM